LTAEIRKRERKNVDLFYWEAHVVLHRREKREKRGSRKEGPGKKVKGSRQSLVPDVPLGESTGESALNYGVTFRGDLGEGSQAQEGTARVFYVRCSQVG